MNTVNYWCWGLHWKGVIYLWRIVISFACNHMHYVNCSQEGTKWGWQKYSCKESFPGNRPLNLSRQKNLRDECSLHFQMPWFLRENTLSMRTPWLSKYTAYLPQNNGLVGASEYFQGTQAVCFGVCCHCQVDIL